MDQVKKVQNLQQNSHHIKTMHTSAHNQSPIRVTDNKRKKFSNFSDAHPEKSPNLRENLQ
jgi:hypothetical protein